MTKNDERFAQFEGLMKQINNDKIFKNEESGEKLLSLLSDRPINVDSVSSGSLVLDQVLGGGIAKGRVIEIYGPESSGKTSIALTAVGNIQKQGGNAVFIDAENALDPRYAARLGVNVQDLAVAQPSSAETALNLVTVLANSGVVDVIVLDSVAALVPKAELEGTMEDNTIGLLARLMSRALKKIVQNANRTKTTVIFLNQVRDKVGGFSPYGPVQTTPGGKALKFFASQRIEIKKIGIIKGEGASKSEAIGTEVRFKIVKNKVAPPFGQGETVLTFNKGINVPAEIIQTGPKYGAITKTSPRTYVETETGEVFATSKAEALKAVETDPELFERLSKAIQKSVVDNLYGTNNDSVDSSDEKIENDSLDEDDPLDEDI